MIVQELYKIQNQHGYLPRVELEGLAQRLATPLYRIQEVVSFFPHFRITPPPDVEVHVCIDMACHLRGGEQMVTELTKRAEGSEAKIEVCGVSCLGRCDRAVAVRVFDHRHTTTSDHASGNGHARHSAGHEPHTLLGRSVDDVTAVMNGDKTIKNDLDADLPDISDRWRINLYANKPAAERYAAINRFIASGKDDAARDVERERVLKALETGNLLGMGGAGGRTYKKWGEVRKAVGDVKYVVCNGDESEPGTFKDRELLLRTPYLIVEGMILAGLIVNAERGYVYIRHEFEEQIASVRAEIERAKEMGVCGDNILGTTQSFQLEVFVSPGGYICGEQTALIQAIQDQRAEPRNRPPELQTNGLWDMPTLLNNVETFAWVPAITEKEEGAWFAAQATKEEFKGARFFSVSGDVNKPAAVEVPIGIKIGELIERCGGMKDGQKLLAIALSGPSGGFIPAKFPLEAFPPDIVKRLPAGATEVDICELELDIALFRRWKLMMGAGIVIYGDKTNLVEQALACLKFYKRESCGKCVPCRIGSTRMVEWGEQLQQRSVTKQEVELLGSSSGPLQELAMTMRSTAICGLGTVAPNPLTTLLAFFPEQVASYTKS